jgi:hypothetical protein
MATSYLNKALRTPVASTARLQIPQSSIKQNPAEVLGLVSQALARNKRLISTFLYNKSKFIRNLILSNKYLT